MDIPALSTAMSQSQLLTAVDASVTKMAMDTSKQNADSMLHMMNSMHTAPHPYLGEKLDVKA
jgi:hypothetical protein